MCFLYWSFLGRHTLEKAIQLPQRSTKGRVGRKADDIANGQQIDRPPIFWAIGGPLMTAKISGYFALLKRILMTSLSPLENSYPAALYAAGEWNKSEHHSASTV